MRHRVSEPGSEFQKVNAVSVADHISTIYTDTTKKGAGTRTTSSTCVLIVISDALTGNIGITALLSRVYARSRTDRAIGVASLNSHLVFGPCQNYRRSFEFDGQRLKGASVERPFF